MTSFKNNWAQSATEYVDKHKNEPNWINEMIAYYTAPEHPYRIHEYTQLVLDYLFEIRNK